MKSLLLITAVFVTSWVTWHIACKRGLALIDRRPALLWWVSLDDLVGTASVFALAGAWASEDWGTRLGVALAGLLGSQCGCLSAKAVDWKHK